MKWFFASLRSAGRWAGFATAATTGLVVGMGGYLIAALFLTEYFAIGWILITAVLAGIRGGKSVISPPH